MSNNRITVFDPEINNALDEMIETRKEKWNLTQDKLNEMKSIIGKLIAQKEFLEKLNPDNPDDRIKRIFEELEKRINEYNDYKTDCQPLADLLIKEISVLESLKRNY